MVPTEHLRKHPVVYGTCIFQFSFGFFWFWLFFRGYVLWFVFLLGGGRVFVCVYVCFGFVAFFVLVSFIFFPKYLYYNLMHYKCSRRAGGHGFSKSGGHVVAHILLPWIGSHVSIWARLVLAEADLY